VANVSLRHISRDTPGFSRAQVGGPFGIGRRHMGGVGNTQLPSAGALTASVSNGVISGGGATGQVSRAGAVSGNAVVLGMKFDFVGNFRGGQASGTLVGPNGCPGRWTATKS